ncbi:MAG: hypothetical protein NWE95_02670 [Candidatus Bathyarchaeota archaeon]|nr:hypothetical protein [Candidatus Bathyarchaeota archaeon]
MPKVPQFRTKGQSGEYAVASLLSKFSNVMVPDYDIGLDFCCELLENGASTGIFFGFKLRKRNTLMNVGVNTLKKIQLGSG